MVAVATAVYSTYLGLLLGKAWKHPLKLGRDEGGKSNMDATKITAIKTVFLSI